MAETIPAPKVGDDCPIDGGEFVRREPATDKQRAAAKDRDNPVPFPPLVDSATEGQIAELGELYVCATCGYRTRMHPEAPEPEPEAAPAPQATAPVTNDRASTLERENADLRRQLDARHTAPTTGA